MASSTLELVRHFVGLVVILLTTGLVGGQIARVLRVPDVAVYLLLGIVIGPWFHWVNLSPQTVSDQFLITTGATLILFDGGRAIRIGVLRQVWVTILLLAVPGVLITAGITMLASSWLLGLPMLFAFLLAGIIASTDPATLIPVFHQVPIEDRVKETVETESAFNDATGSIVTYAALGLIGGGQAFSVGGSIANFLKMAGGGLGVGFVAGALAALLISDRKSGFLRDYASVVALVVAVGTYWLADLLGVSGFMATFTAGLVLGNHHSFGWTVDEERLQEVGHFFDGVTLIFRMMIFILLGSQVDFAALAAYWWQGLLIVLVLMFVARPVTVFLCAWPDRRAHWTLKELLFMCWVRETGVIPAALVAMIAAMNVPHAKAIQAVTFMAILITIVVQAGTTGVVARKLGVATDVEDTAH